MGVFLVDSFSFDFDKGASWYNTQYIETYFNDVKGTFIVKQRTTYTENGGVEITVGAYNFNTVNVSQRGKTPDQVIFSNCIGFENTIFKSILTTPYVSVTLEQNSISCGFVAPPPPPPPTPPPPPPVCDLVLTAVSTAITSLTAKDGTIAVTTNSVIESYYVVELWNNGIIVKSATLYPIDNFVFNNLEKGNYLIKARAISYDCNRETNVVVNGFVFNEKYWFEFCEKRYGKRTVRVSIKKAGYTGSTTEIKIGSANLVELNYPTIDATQKFYEILGSDLTVRFIADTFTDLSDIYTDNERQYRLDLTFVSTNDLIWSGYILPDQSTIPFKSLPYVVTIKATDGVKVLEDIDFDIFEGRMTWIEGIKYCLDKTDLLLPFKSSIDINSVGTGKNVLLTGLNANAYGLTTIINAGSWKINGELFLKNTNTTFVFQQLTRFRRTIIFATKIGISFLQGADDFAQDYPKLPAESIMIAKGFTNGTDFFIISRTPLFLGDDTLSTKTFDVKRFGKEDGGFTDCYNVLKWLVRQYTANLKQSNGFWCIENIGNKSRNLIIKEFAYNNDLTVIYANQDIDLSVDVSCGSSDLVLSGGQISIGAGYKKVTVRQLIGLPQPVIKNFNFETWIDDGGQEVPAFWQFRKPYGWFSKGAKIDRIYNPTTAEITEVENGTYYFNIKKGSGVVNTIQSSSIAVFNQEIISINIQAIITNTIKDSFKYSVGFSIKIGNYVFANFEKLGNFFEPKWILDDGNNKYFFRYFLDYEKGFFTAYNDATNLNIETTPAPVQGFLTIGIYNIFTEDQKGFYNSGKFFDYVSGILYSDLGFDNFKISKRIGVENVKIISENTTTLENKAKFSTIPDAYETYFTDVDNLFRTDSIKDLNGKPTEKWTRTGISESETINVILARDILAQYQKTFRYFEGSLLGENMSIRSVFNLPTFDLYRFVCNGGKFDLLNCEADLTIVEVYAEDGITSAPIGGGTGAGGGGTVNNDQFVLGFANKVLTDGNNNLFLSDGN